MGLIENGTQDIDSKVIEQPKMPQNLPEDPKCEHPTPDKYKMDSERLVTVMVDQEEVIGVQSIAKKLISMEGCQDRVEEMEPNHEGISENVGADKLEPILNNVKTFSVTENLEAVCNNGLINFENVGVPCGTSSVNPVNGNLESAQADAFGGSGHRGNEDIESSGQLRKRIAKLKTPVTSSWSLRSKSQEKPKAPEPNDTVKEGSANGEKKKRGRKKKERKKNIVDEFSRIRTHLRYLLHRIKYEQSLIDAYSAEGWKGQSLEKLKPEKELQRAKSHILRYKLKIRALFQRLDLSLAVGKLPASLFDSKGEIDSEDIFCAKCGLKDLTLDNDIILCDGACERGFHQFCLEPPLLKEDIPPGDEGWLCPGCNCKADCIDMLKDFQGTKISIIDSWEKIFPEAAAVVSGKKLDDGSGFSSDDSKDDDYDPDKPDTADKDEGNVSSSNESKYFSASDDLAASLNNEKHLGLPSDDSEDDDFDPSSLDQEKQVKQDSSSSDFTSDSEDLGALLEDDTDISPSSDCKQPSQDSIEEDFKLGRGKRPSLKDELSYLMDASAEPVLGTRHVERLDYKKLHDETYGNSSSDSSDEDFEDTTARKRRRTDREKSEVKSPNMTPITESTRSTKDENRKESEQLPKRILKHNDEGGTNESAEVGSVRVGTKRSAQKRLGEAATQRLYASFNENQYPERAGKENLAKELGLTFQQVNKWFENARWSFHHRSRMESNSNEKPREPQLYTGWNTNYTNQSVPRQESSAIPAQDHTAEREGGNSVTITSGENSGTLKSGKRKAMLNQAPGEITVTNKTLDLNALVDMGSPELHNNRRRTRNSSSVE